MDDTRPADPTRPEPSTARQVGAVAAVGLLAALVGLFVVGALVLVTEGVGPSSTEQGRVLERTDTSRTRTVCDFTRPGGVFRDRCRTFDVPGGAVGGQFPDGDTWSVVSRQAYDSAPRPGTDVEVTVSSLTGRVTGFDGPRRFDDSWSLTGSPEFIVFVAFGTLLAGLIVTVVVLARRKHGRAVPISARALAISSVVGGGVGLFGLVWLLFVADDQYDPLSAQELYGGGGLIADPYEFAGSAADAEEAGRVVETDFGAATPFTARVVAPDELGAPFDRVRSDLTPVVVVAEGVRRAPLALTVAGLGEDGGRVEPVPCGLDGTGVEGAAADGVGAEGEAIEGFPVAISADQRIVAGVFCLPQPPVDDTVIIGDNPFDDGGVAARLAGEPDS